MRPRHVPVLLSAACADVARRHSSGGDRAPVRTCCVRSAMPPTNASSGPGADGHMRHYAMAFRISISAVVAGGSCGSP